MRAVRGVVVSGFLVLGILSLSCSKKSTPPTEPPPPQLGEVEVLSAPAGASILLDGASTTKTTPDTLKQVGVGARVIGLRLANYADTAVTVNIASGVLARVSVSLRHFSTYVPPAIQLELHAMAVSGTIGAIATADFDTDGNLDLVVTSTEIGRASCRERV